MACADGNLLNPVRIFFQIENMGIIALNVFTEKLNERSNNSFEPPVYRRVSDRFPFLRSNHSNQGVSHA